MTMTPEDAINRLVETLSKADASFTEDDIYSSMASAGVPTAIADRAYKFAQIACGRMLLDGIGVRFAKEFYCFDANGRIIESGEISNEPFFVAAQRVATPARVGGQSFNRFALMAADVHAVNELLNRGSKPQDLITSPSFVFLEPPTEEGLQNAQREISIQMEQIRRDNPPPRPWWKFW